MGGQSRREPRREHELLDRSRDCAAHTQTGGDSSGVHNALSHRNSHEVQVSGISGSATRIRDEYSAGIRVVKGRERTGRAGRAGRR